jgi:hypothetical protein
MQLKVKKGIVSLKSLEFSDFGKLVFEFLNSTKIPLVSTIYANHHKSPFTVNLLYNTQFQNMK